MNRPDIPAVFRTHPQSDSLLAKHPVERFGCTPCHGGQGLALTAAAAHGDGDPHWLDPLVERSLLESRCRACHAAQDSLPYATRLADGLRLFRDLGCAQCHASDDLPPTEKRGPSLRKVASKLGPGALVSWIRNPTTRRPDRRMPNFWPDDGTAAMNDKRNEEPIAIAAYLLAKSEPYTAAGPSAIDPSLAETGHALFDRVGCRGCHALGRPGLDDLELTRPDPKRQTRAIADLFGDEPDTPAPSVPALSPIVHGPPLASIASCPAILCGGMAAGPAAYWPAANMPNLRLSARSSCADSLSVFPPTRRSSPAPAQLEERLRPTSWSEAGASSPRMDVRPVTTSPNSRTMGNPVRASQSSAQSRSTNFILASNGASMGSVRGLPIRARSSRRLALLQRRISRLRCRASTSTIAELDALVVYLGGMRRTRVPEEYRAPPHDRVHDRATRVLAKYNCFVPRLRRSTRRHHTLLRRHEPRGTTVDRGGGESNPNGYSTSCFIEAVAPLANASNALLRDEHRRGSDPRRVLRQRGKETDPTPRPASRFDHAERAALGAKLFERLECVTCHMLANRASVEMFKLAPDLGLARQRLDRDWVRAFLDNPAAKLPGTNMPQFFPGGQTPAADILDGNAAAQMELLVDYVMSLGLQPVDAIRTSAMERDEQ